VIDDAVGHFLHIWTLAEHDLETVMLRMLTPNRIFSSPLRFLVMDAGALAHTLKQYFESMKSMPIWCTATEFVHG
jgi:hypothetical protein